MLDAPNANSNETIEEVRGAAAYDLDEYCLADFTFSRFLARKAAKNGDKIFLRYLEDGRSYSYRDIDLQSNILANGLMAKGLKPGSHVAIMVDNCPEQLLLYFALAKLGAVAVPINTSARGSLLQYYLTQSDAVVFICETQFISRFAEIQGQTPLIEKLVELRSGEDEARPTLTPQLIDFEELIVGSASPPDVEVKFSDLAMLSYTSGTTGPSKANLMTQVMHLRQGMTGVRYNGYLSDDVVYICVPINHSNGLWAVLQAMWADATVALSRRFSMSRYWDEVISSGATFTNILSSMVNWLWSSPASPRDRLHRLRVCSVAPIPTFVREFQERFGIRTITGYGISDFGIVCTFTLDDPEEKYGSCGRPRSTVEVRIADDDDCEVAAGQVGEILLRTRDPWSIAQGYYKMPTETLAANRNQWFHTGDRGYLDSDGYLFFVDRKKDSIRRRGENISSYEVERIIASHDAVMDVAVYPLNADTIEDEVAATVVLKQGCILSEMELVSFCAVNMARYMVPRFVEFDSLLPRTSTAKIEKYKLRERATANLARMWDRERA